MGTKQVEISQNSLFLPRFRHFFLKNSPHCCKNLIFRVLSLFFASILIAFMKEGIFGGLYSIFSADVTVNSSTFPTLGLEIL